MSDNNNQEPPKLNIPPLQNTQQSAQQAAEAAKQFQLRGFPAENATTRFNESDASKLQKSE